ncbi:hypothetical protein Emag_004820 [Eimeria magna]
MALPDESEGCTDIPACIGSEAGEDRISEQGTGLTEICGDPHLFSDATTSVDLCLYPGRSCRRKEYTLDTTLWKIKEDCERELRIPALVVAVAPVSSLPLSPLPWSTLLREIGCTAGGLSKLGVYLFRRAEDGEGPLPQLDSVGGPECLTDATAGRRRCMQSHEPLRQKCWPDTVSKSCPLSLIAEMRQRRDLRIQQKLQQLQRQQWEAEVRRKRQQQRADNPVTPADFALLLAEVEAWRRLEAEKILAKGGPPRKHREALLLLLQQETQLLQRIGRLKQQADKDRKKQQQQRLLEKMGAPLIWVQSNGETAAVHTPQTTRAGELHSVFNRLSAEPQKVSERLGALAAAREAVGTHEGPLADELRELLAREESLLKRGRCNRFFLSGLRQRISNEFYQLLLDTSFNRQAELVTKTAVF